MTDEPSRASSEELNGRTSRDELMETTSREELLEKLQVCLKIKWTFVLSFGCFCWQT